MCIRDRLCTEENKIEAGILSLKPWCGYDIPLNMTETKYTSIIMGVIPNIVEMDELKSQLLQTNDR